MKKTGLAGLIGVVVLSVGLGTLAGKGIERYVHKRQLSDAKYSIKCVDDEDTKIAGMSFEEDYQKKQGTKNLIYIGVGGLAGLFMGGGIVHTILNPLSPEELKSGPYGNGW